jgi:hypothetical protein
MLPKKIGGDSDSVADARLETLDKREGLYCKSDEEVEQDRSWYVVES